MWYNIIKFFKLLINFLLKLKTKKYISALMFSMLLLGSFFALPGVSSAVNNGPCDAADIKVVFEGTDSAGKAVTSLPIGSDVIYYAAYDRSVTCSGSFKSEIFLTKTDGTTIKSLGTQNLTFAAGTTAQMVHKITLGVSGLTDGSTNATVQPGGKIYAKSVLYVGSATVASWPPKNIAVTAQGTAPINTGKYEQADYSKGLVPCGRGSAITADGYAGGRPDDSCTVRDIFYLFIKVTNYLIFMAGFFATFQIVRASFGMVISQGNPEHTKKDKNAFIYSVIGLCFAFMAFLLVNTVINGILGLKDGTDILSNPVEYITSWSGSTNNTNSSGN